MSCKVCGAPEGAEHGRSCYTTEAVQEREAAPVAPDTVSRKEYLAMARQRDAFRKAYEVLEAATKQAYRDLTEVTTADADDFLCVQQVRTELLAAWNEAEERADASGRPPRRRVPR